MSSDCEMKVSGTYSALFHTESCCASACLLCRDYQGWWEAASNGAFLTSSILDPSFRYGQRWPGTSTSSTYKKASRSLEQVNIDVSKSRGVHISSLEGSPRGCSQTLGRCWDCHFFIAV